MVLFLCSHGRRKNCFAAFDAAESQAVSPVEANPVTDSEAPTAAEAEPLALPDSARPELEEAGSGESPGATTEQVPEPLPESEVNESAAVQPAAPLPSTEEHREEVALEARIADASLKVILETKAEVLNPAASTPPSATEGASGDADWLTERGVLGVPGSLQLPVDKGALEGRHIQAVANSESECMGGDNSAAPSQTGGVGWGSKQYSSTPDDSASDHSRLEAAAAAAESATDAVHADSDIASALGEGKPESLHSCEQSQDNQVQEKTAHDRAAEDACGDPVKAGAADDLTDPSSKAKEEGRRNSREKEEAASERYSTARKSCCVQL